VKVAVEGGERGSVLDRQRGQMGVAGQVGGCSGGLDQVSEDRWVPAGGGDQRGRGEVDPVFELVECVGDAERLVVYARVRRNAQEPQQNDPGQADRLAARQRGLEPPSCARVMACGLITTAEEDRRSPGR